MIHKDDRLSPPPSPGPPDKYNDQGTRRFRVEILQRQLIDIDVTAGPSPDDQDEQAVRFIATRLMDAVRSNPGNPSAWRAALERTFPEPIGETKWLVGDIVDVGPGVQLDRDQQVILGAYVAAGEELPAVIPKNVPAAIESKMRALPAQAEIVEIHEPGVVGVTTHAAKRGEDVEVRLVNLPPGRCSACQRGCWSQSSIGTPCRFPQSGGSTCPGTFERSPL